MIEVRPFDSLGRFENEWLNARHHFSFGHYHDPEPDGASARCGSGTTTRSRPAPGSTRIRTGTWRSSPMSVRARSRIATIWATRAGPRRATCR